MADIISFDNKRQLAEDIEKTRIKQRKIQAVRQLFQCTQCASKCIKCGAPIETPHRPDRRAPYRFCELCTEDYIAYIDRLKGASDPNCYWHNDIWLEAWGKWIEYQSLMDRYVQSKEFLRLLQDLKPTTPES